MYCRFIRVSISEDVEHKINQPLYSSFIEISISEEIEYKINQPLYNRLDLWSIRLSMDLCSPLQPRSCLQTKVSAAAVVDQGSSSADRSGQLVAVAVAVVAAAAVVGGLRNCFAGT